MISGWGSLGPEFGWVREELFGGLRRIESVRLFFSIIIFFLSESGSSNFLSPISDCNIKKA